MKQPLSCSALAGFTMNAAAQGTARAAASFTVEITGRGQPGLMISGLMSDREVWRPAAEMLAEGCLAHFPGAGCGLHSDWLAEPIRRALQESSL